MKCLVQFAQAHPEFRIPELLSIAELYGVQIDFDKTQVDIGRPYMVVDLDEDGAKKLAGRCILVKAVYELYAMGDTYEELHSQTKDNEPLWDKYKADARFRFQIIAYNHTIPDTRRTEIMESFSFMDWRGVIDVKNADVVLTCIEEYAPKESKIRKRHENDGEFIQAYFGRLIAEGTARDLIRKYDVKKRLYFGNTSMEAEISLLMANQALAAPGKLIYDPFAGTGSMLYTSAHFGALLFGSDIDGRQMRGKSGDSSGVYVCAEAYGLRSRILDLATFDLTQNPWRCGGIFDAIVTDPPYGVRAGAKRLGRRERPPKEHKIVPSEMAQLPMHLRPNYVPPTRPYELADLAMDLVLQARHLLKPHGRLVYFLPTVNDEYQDIDVPVCEGMEVISNSLQNFGAWGRRLITMEKVSCQDFASPISQGPLIERTQTTPAHRGFRDKYFAGFQKINSSPSLLPQHLDNGST